MLGEKHALLLCLARARVRGHSRGKGKGTVPQSRGQASLSACTDLAYAAAERKSIELSAA